MPVALIHPDNLETLTDTPDEIDADLEVTDSRDDYALEDGDGAWIGAYLNFLERIVRRRCHLTEFNFSDSDRINQELFDEIPDAYTRALLIRFTNEHYESWHNDDVELPDYDDVRTDCRSYCDDCESGWEVTYGEYDGPLAEDVEEDEDDNAADLTDQERTARRQRNRERSRERQRRERAKEDAESEVIDRDFVCDDSCDGFYEHVSDVYHDRIDLNTDALRRRWEEFLKDAGEDRLPAMQPEAYERSGTAV